MVVTDALIVAGSIVFAGWLIAKAVEDGLAKVSERIDNNSRLVERVGTKLDALWSPLSGLNNALWEMTHDPNKRHEVDEEACS